MCFRVFLFGVHDLGLVAPSPLTLTRNKTRHTPPHDNASLKTNPNTKKEQKPERDEGRDGCTERGRETVRWEEFRGGNLGCGVGGGGGGCRVGNCWSRVVWCFFFVLLFLLKVSVFLFFFPLFFFLHQIKPKIPPRYSTDDYHITPPLNPVTKRPKISLNFSPPLPTTRVPASPPPIFSLPVVSSLW